MSLPHHHKSVRKRLSKKLAPFPHPIRWKRRLDQAITLFGVLNVIAGLPQLLEIWANQSAGNVSAITWAYYSLYSVTMLMYGIVHREKPIIISYIGNVTMSVAITVGAIIY